VGGKRSILPELISRLPAAYRTYCEPFLGGAALFNDRQTVSLLAAILLHISSVVGSIIAPWCAIHARSERISAAGGYPPKPRMWRAS
jgi:site-specific DNA-adenine methylase